MQKTYSSISHQSAMSFKGLIAVVACLWLAFSVGASIFSNYHSNEQLVKLERDKVIINRAIIAYLAEGGDLKGGHGVHKILSKIKEKRNGKNAFESAGITGNYLDARLSFRPVLKDEVGMSWDPRGEKFVTGGTGGFAFYFDDQLKPVPVQDSERSFAAYAQPNGENFRDLDLNSKSKRSGGYLVTLTQGDPPVAVPDSYSMRDGEPLVGNLLANDRAPDGGELRVLKTTVPGNGSVDVLQGGSFTYTTGETFSATDFFHYTIVSPDGQEATAMAKIDIQSSTPPAAHEDVFSTKVGQSVVGNLLANDSDFDGDLFELAANTDPDHGVLTVSNNGAFEYIPGDGFSGTDSFSYTIEDSTGKASTSTVSLEVIQPNRPPAPVPDSVTLVVGGSDTLINILANDSDPDGDSLSVIGQGDLERIAPLSQPDWYGEPVVHISSDGRLAVDYNREGSYTLEYTISDGRGGVETSRLQFELEKEKLPHYESGGVEWISHSLTAAKTSRGVESGSSWGQHSKVVVHHLPYVKHDRWTKTRYRINGGEWKEGAPLSKRIYTKSKYPDGLLLEVEYLAEGMVPEKQSGKFRIRP